MERFPSRHYRLSHVAYLPHRLELDCSSGTYAKLHSTNLGAIGFGTFEISLLTIPAFVIVGAGLLASPLYDSLGPSTDLQLTYCS